MLPLGPPPPHLQAPVQSPRLLLKSLPASAEDTGDAHSIPGSGRAPGVGSGSPLQYSCLENPHGQRSLAGYSPRGCKELDMTEHIGFTQVCTRPHCPSGAPCAAPAFTTHQLWEGHSLPGPLTSARPHSQDRPPSHTSEEGMREGWGRGRSVPSHSSHILFTRERLRLVFSQRWGQPGSRSGHSLARAPGSVRGKPWGSINGRFLNNTTNAFFAGCCTMFGLPWWLRC